MTSLLPVCNRIVTGWRITGVLAVMLLTACADNPPAPVEDRNRVSGHSHGPTLQVGKPYTVRRGDTLYSIAFRLGLDFKALARRNAITSPYTIYPGQVIATDLRWRDSAPVSSVAPKTTAKTAKPATPVKSTPKTVAKAAPKAAAKAPSTATRSTAPSKSTAKKPATKTSQAAPANRLVSRWRWPSSGKVIRGYENPVHKGIDIAGARGDAVRAVAPGSVVYAGTGVTGYGALIIVKHNDDFLSAYGHNDALLVEEGAQVKEGQLIARMGSSGTDTVKLHFEIRRRGSPVDPMKILPAR